MLKGITVKTESIVVLSLLVTMLKESVTRVFMALMDKTSDLSHSMKTAQAATSSKRNHRATNAQLSNRGAAIRKMAAINSDMTPSSSVVQSREAVAGGDDWEEF